MRFAFFVHSAASDWNHGNAHFIRGLMDALSCMGHDVGSWEPRDGWSLRNLLEDEGIEAVVQFARAYPRIEVHSYDPDEERLDAHLKRAAAGADVVLVHEWTEAVVVDRLAELARGDRFALLFHDTHHRAVTMPRVLDRLPLGSFHGVLAFGRSLAALYRERYGVRRVWTFHEAADVRRFRPLDRPKEHDVVWIGNWGDDERSAELHEYLLGSARRLPGLRFRVHGVRYPEDVLREMSAAGIDHRGWVSSVAVPEVLAGARVTMHVPRHIYVRALPGIPTIRVFEALACGIPLVCTPWRDVEGLFGPGVFTMVTSPQEMAAGLERIARDEEHAARLAENGLRVIHARHTCDHRAAELLHVLEQVGRAGSDVRPVEEGSVCA